jgi:F-type H+-transporting ATPase subunit gamma
LNAISEVERHPLLEKRAVSNRLYVVVTSNSGLAGAYNANILKLLTQALRVDQANKVNSHVIAIGTKGAQFVRRLQDVELVAVYPSFGDQPTANDIRPILNTILELFGNKTIDEVEIIFTVSRSSISQTAQTKQLLPAIEAPTASGVQPPTVSTFEPDIETVIAQVGTRLIEAQIWQAVLESLASEHAMRMVAMKNATDNANDLITDYTLEYNTARQGAITQELAEITGGAEALRE